MVKLEHVNKYFNRRRKNELHVINNTSLELGGSGLVALLGPSGCGKTTLMKILTGQLPPDSGEVVVGQTIKIGYYAQEIGSGEPEPASGRYPLYRCENSCHGSHEAGN